jgi:hypothetical protein
LSKGITLSSNSSVLAIISLYGSEKTQLKNLWTKKNPFLSMWLSGANAVAGSARSRITAEGKRQAATVRTKSAKQIASIWSAALLAPLPPKKKRKRR